MKFTFTLLALLAVALSVPAQTPSCPPDDKEQLRQMAAYIDELQADTTKFRVLAEQLLQNPESAALLEPILQRALDKLAQPENRQKPLKALFSEADWQTIRTLVCQLLMQSQQGEVVTGIDKTQYYFTTKGDTTKYGHSSELYKIRQSQNLYLKVAKRSDTLQKSKLYWKIDGERKCDKVDSCQVALGTTGSRDVEVYDDKGLLTKMKVVVYKKPMIVFQPERNYRGTYGFDDGYRFRALQASGDYETINMDGTYYYVPWVSSLNNQDITLRLDVNALNSGAGKDKDFRVTLKCNNPDVLINRSDSVTLTYTQLNANPFVQIASPDFNHANFTNPALIEAHDHKGALLGKMRLVCDNPLVRRVVLVYVDYGTGYSTIPRNEIINYLNQNSHNQFFRQWEIERGRLGDSLIRDTLNISTMYKINSEGFMSRANVLGALVGVYRARTGINMELYNNPVPGNKIYFFFVSKLMIPAANGTDAVGGKAVRGGNIGALFDKGGLEEVGHEVGHLLNLHHTFPDGVNAELGPRLVPQGTTKNYMDYINSGRNMFFIYQWRAVQ